MESILMAIVELPSKERKKCLLGPDCHRSDAEKEAEEALSILFNLIAAFLTNTWIGNRIFACFFHALHLHKRIDRTGLMICLFSILWLLLSLNFLLRFSSC